MAIDFSFNLFEENEFNSVFPEPRNGKEVLQRDLFLQLMRSDSLANRSGRLTKRDEEMIKRAKEEIDALVIALTALKEESE
tara:strand:- start:190 stop:432 length:243 start_codon:yes stop_codon:yes gene_type:complete